MRRSKANLILSTLQNIKPCLILVIMYKIKSSLKQAFKTLFEKKQQQNNPPKELHSCFTPCSLGVGKISSDARELSQRHNIQSGFFSPI